MANYEDMMSGEFEQFEDGMRKVGCGGGHDETLIAKSEGEWRCMFEGELVGVSSTWPKFSACEKFGGSDFTCRVKLLPPILMQLGVLGMCFLGLG